MTDVFTALLFKGAISAFMENGLILPVALISTVHMSGIRPKADVVYEHGVFLYMNIITLYVIEQNVYSGLKECIITG